MPGALENDVELGHFVTAQEPVYGAVLAELRAGRKRSHWMWFIFPQIAGLGHSAMAQRYLLGSRDQARAYLDHPLLGVRLRECCALLLAIEGRAIGDILGAPDDIKLRSCLTLFLRAAPAASDQALFQACLDKYFGGQLDPATLARL